MLQAASSENLRLGVDPWIPRLPTPVPPMSLSRASSMASLRSDVAPDKYGHVRPLPSPCPDHVANVSSANSIRVTTSDEEESSPTSVSKTNAFFSSPFSIAVARKPPGDAQRVPFPALTPTRQGARDDTEKELLVVGQAPDSPSPKPRIPSDSHVSPSRQQVVTSSSFFGPSRPASLNTPIPPPNLEPIVTKKPNTALSGFTSLSRFFPLRNRSSDPDTAQRTVEVIEPTPPPSSVEEVRPALTIETPSSPSQILTLRRSFVELRPETPGRSSLEDDEWCISPTASTSGPLLQVPSPTRSRIRQASPERLLAHAHQAAQRAQASPPSDPFITKSRDHNHSNDGPSIQHPPLRRETDQSKDFPTPEPVPGQVIGAPATPLKLIKPLGHGAFSSVWLATDETAELALTRSASIGRGLNRQGSAGKRVVKRRRPTENWAKKQSDRKVGGLKPHPAATPAVPEGGDTSRTSLDGGENWRSPTPTSLGRNPSLSKPLGPLGRPEQRVVAVKMMDRAMCDANDRTRISFVREVEILRHISHPSIVSYLHSFSTETHHCLILEHVTGGELFDLLNNDSKHSLLTEPLLRRMWSELCRAVAWMHSVALVHRDIKLENILLTCDLFSPQYIMPGTGSPSLALLPTPLLKLTDFGLSRFIDPDQPLLATRCGSESYAAPEIVMATKYDGRQTDAWACGVVLFALATRVLPFDRVAFGNQGGSIGSGGSAGGSEYGGSSIMSVSESGRGRRSYLIRIAKNEYAWPTGDGLGGAADRDQRLATPGLKKVVERLLVRDPKKRATVAQVWDEEWMGGDGGLPRPGEGFRIHIEEPKLSNGVIEPSGDMPTPKEEMPETPNIGEEDDLPDVAEAGDEDLEPDMSSGLLVNGESIANVARLDIN
ncbi:hypothetical protein FRB94_010280 [Tulasnella sp. JGI-2019a]|nr:hypothetical protein FRB94_010280 [Tulasnella sp. JGI-2019a]KAG9012351.1 hypothetical protein FRB93_001773 [Tulasnella sp. JGI-2019a]